MIAYVSVGVTVSALVSAAAELPLTAMFLLPPEEAVKAMALVSVVVAAMVMVYFRLALCRFLAFVLVPTIDSLFQVPCRWLVTRFRHFC